MSFIGVPILVIPGWSNSGPAHWQSVWERDDPSFTRVEQSNWLNPDLTDWIQTIDRAVSHAPAPAVLVAHSLGCIAVAQWASSGMAALGDRIRGALLVAPADVDATSAPAATIAFGPVPRLRLPFRSAVVASRTDMYCAIERAQELAGVWGSAFFDVGDAGHINVESGHGPWSAGKKYLETLLPANQGSSML